MEHVPGKHGNSLPKLFPPVSLLAPGTFHVHLLSIHRHPIHIKLTFSDFVITSMVRGKKVMHLFEKPPFDYLPGETMIVPANETMVIDFPEAQVENPTQCIARAVDERYVNNTLQYLNTFYNSDRSEEHEWKLHFNQYHFDNDTEVTDLINKLMRVCNSGDKAKNIFADLNLKELLIRLVQSQHLQQVKADSGNNNNQNRPSLCVALYP